MQDTYLGRRRVGEAAHVQGRAESKEGKAVKKSFLMGDEQKFRVGPVQDHEEPRPGSGSPEERAMDAKSLTR